MGMDRSGFNKIILDIQANWTGEGVLNLGGQSLDDDQMVLLAKALRGNTSVKSLSLGANQIGDAGAQALAEAIKTNATLRQLWLNGNQIGDAGAQALAEAIKANTTLRQLELNYNQIGDAGAQALAAAIKANATLWMLELKYNQIGEAMMVDIQQLMSEEGMEERRKQFFGVGQKQMSEMFVEETQMLKELCANIVSYCTKDEIIQYRQAFLALSNAGMAAEAATGSSSGNVNAASVVETNTIAGSAAGASIISASVPAIR